MISRVLGISVPRARLAQWGRDQAVFSSGGWLGITVHRKLQCSDPSSTLGGDFVKKEGALGSLLGRAWENQGHLSWWLCPLFLSPSWFPATQETRGTPILAPVSLRITPVAASRAEVAKFIGPIRGPLRRKKGIAQHP